MHARQYSVGIVTKAGHEAAGKLGRKAAGWLRDQGYAVSVAEHCMQGFGYGAGEKGPPELIVVLGGDGTLLSVARQTLQRCPALFGVNMGNLGFLSVASPDNWQERLAAFLDGALPVEERMVLSGRVLRQGQLVHDVLAVNDFVISRGAMARIIKLRLYHGREEVSRIRADGIIFYSPTGSTAYAVSAGGPVVHPSLDLIGVATICPFMSRLHSMILPPDPPLYLEIDDKGDELFLTEDGQSIYPLQTGDVIEVRRHPQRLRLAQGEEGDAWYRALRRKGFSEV